MSEFTIGLDIGQTIDPTAIAIVQRVDDGAKPRFQCGHLERLPLNTYYPDVVLRVRQLLADQRFHGRCELVLDMTGVGRPIADQFRDVGVRPIKVTITGGTVSEETINDRGEYHVAKMTLISTVQALLHAGRLLVQKDLPEAPALRAELEDFRASVTDFGRWKFGAREGAHDDLVLALALACWRANRRDPTRIHPSVLARSAQIGTRPVLGAVGYGELNRSDGDLMRLQAQALARGRSWESGR
jgi:hypothetical protein